MGIIGYKLQNISIMHGVLNFIRVVLLKNMIQLGLLFLLLYIRAKSFWFSPKYVIKVFEKEN